MEIKGLEKLERIHLIPYAHHDHAWTNTRQWHVWRYLEGFRLGLECLRENEDYTFLVDNVLHSLEAFERYCPSMIEEFRARVREGRIAVNNGGMALVRPTNSGDELYLRNMAKGRRELMRRLGCADIPVAFNADTAVGHSQLPQILSLCGHRLYRSNRPEAALDRAGLPREMVWRGLDGSKILFSRGNYGGLMFGDCCDAAFPWEEARVAFAREELDVRLPLQQSADLYLNLGCDDSLPLTNLFDKPIDITGFMERWNGNEGPKISFSTPDAYLARLDAADLPEVGGVIDPCDLSYNAPMRQKDSLWYHRFEAERLLTRLEKVLSLQEAAGAPADWAGAEALWTDLMRFSGHAMEWLLREDYEEAIALARQTVTRARRMTAEAADALACRTRRLAPVQYAVLNVNQWDGEQFVPLHVATPRHIRGFTLRDASGNPVPYQITGTYLGDKNYIGKDFNELDVVCALTLPQMGHQALTLEFDGTSALEKAAADLPDSAATGTPVAPRDLVIDNGILRVAICAGAVESVEAADGTVAYRRGNACLSEGHGGRSLQTGGDFGAVLLHRTTPTADWLTNYDDVATDAFVPERCAYAELGPLRWKVEMQGSVGAHPAALSMTLHRNDPVIEYDLTLDNRGCEGYFTASFPGRAGRVEAGIPFGAETRRVDELDYCDGTDGADPLRFERGCRGMFFAKHFAGFDSIENGYLAVLQGDCGIYWRADTAGNRVELLLMKSIDFSARTEKWVRQIGPSIEGRGEQRFRYAVAVFPQARPSDALHRLARRLEQPPVTAVRYSYEPGGIPAAGSLVTIRGTLMLSASYREGEDWVVRLFEAGGRAGQSTLELTEPVAEAVAVDLTGAPCANCAVALGNGGREVTVACEPWKIITLKLRGAR